LIVNPTVQGTMTHDTVTFEEGKTCPVKIEGTGGGLSFSPGGDMLLIGRFPDPSPKQVQAWSGKWRAKLITESEFPAIPIFGVGGEDWLIEAPCNPSQQEREAPGFAEAFYGKDENIMVAVLVDSDTDIIKKIAYVTLDDMFVERLVISWNPFRFQGDQYNKTFTDAEFATRVTDLFKTRNSQKLWMSSW